MNQQGMTPSKMDADTEPQGLLEMGTFSGCFFDEPKSKCPGPWGLASIAAPRSLDTIGNESPVEDPFWAVHDRFQKKLTEMKDFKAVKQ